MESRDWGLRDCQQVNPEMEGLLGAEAWRTGQPGPEDKTRLQLTQEGSKLLEDSPAFTQSSAVNGRWQKAQAPVCPGAQVFLTS